MNDCTHPHILGEETGDQGWVLAFELHIIEGLHIGDDTGKPQRDLLFH